MQPTLDAKKDVILQILAKLKQFNSIIGNYEKSVLTEDFQYTIRLSNGRIFLSQELVHDYEQSPAFVSNEQLKVAAAKFLASEHGNSDARPVTQIVTNLSTEGSKKQQPSASSSNSGLKWILPLTTIIVLIVIGVYFYNQNERQNQIKLAEDIKTNEENNKARIRNNITAYITAERNEYTYSQLGGIYNLKISVTNNTAYLIDNVKVKIIYIKANGGIWDTRIIDFNMLNPQVKSTIKVADTERGTSIQYEIVSIKSNALGLL
jgi:hypothetical protein